MTDPFAELLQGVFVITFGLVTLFCLVSAIRERKDGLRAFAFALGTIVAALLTLVAAIGLIDFAALAV